MRNMTHVDEYLDEYLRGELGRRQTEQVAAHLARCPRCAARADWLEQLIEVTGQVRIEPPAEVVEDLERRLLALPGELESGRFGTVSTPRRIERPVPVTARFPLLGSPALRVAAALLLGVAVGYGLWGRTDQRLGGPEGATDLAPAPSLTAESTARAARSGIVPAAGMTASAGAGPTEELEARVARLERLLLRDHLGRVEAAITHFVNGTADGRVVQLPEGSMQSLLSTTTSLKFDYRTSGNDRMTRLLGQIEAVLTEIEQICCEQNLDNAVVVASRIEDGGILSTLQRMKVTIEE